MRRILMLFLMLFTTFVFAGCTITPKGKAPFKFSTLISVDSQRLDAGPVIAKLPAVKSIDKQKVVKKVYLTFDDGPEATITPTVLDILDRYGVKATFFVIGTCVEKNPGLLKEIVKRGHAVGNHTYNHKYKELYSVKDGFLKSLKTNGELIYGIIGVRPYIVRDPGGKVRNNWPLRKVLGENKYWLVEWNIDSYDSRKPRITPSQIVENIRVKTKNPKIWSSTIILLHDGKGHAETVKALPAIIEMLKKEGFSFEVLK